MSMGANGRPAGWTHGKLPENVCIGAGSGNPVAWLGATRETSCAATP